MLVFGLGSPPNPASLKPCNLKSDRVEVVWKPPDWRMFSKNSLDLKSHPPAGFYDRFSLVKLFEMHVEVTITEQEDHDTTDMENTCR